MRTVPSRRLPNAYRRRTLIRSRPRCDLGELAPLAGGPREPRATDCPSPRSGDDGDPPPWRSTCQRERYEAHDPQQATPVPDVHSANVRTAPSAMSYLRPCFGSSHALDIAATTGRKSGKLAVMSCISGYHSNTLPRGARRPRPAVAAVQEIHPNREATVVPMPTMRSGRFVPRPKSS